MQLKNWSCNKKNNCSNISLKNVGSITLSFSSLETEITFGGDARLPSRIDQSNYFIFLLRPRTPHRATLFLQTHRWKIFRMYYGNKPSMSQTDQPILECWLWQFKFILVKIWRFLQGHSKFWSRLLKIIHCKCILTDITMLTLILFYKMVNFDRPRARRTSGNLLVVIEWWLQSKTKSGPSRPSLNLCQVADVLFCETVPSLSSLFVLSIFRALECVQQYIRDKLKTKISKTVTPRVSFTMEHVTCSSRDEVLYHVMDDLNSLSVLLKRQFLQLEDPIRCQVQLCSEEVVSLNLVKLANNPRHPSKVVPLEHFHLLAF